MSVGLKTQKVSKSASNFVNVIDLSYKKKLSRILEIYSKKNPKQNY